MQIGRWECWCTYYDDGGVYAIVLHVPPVTVQYEHHYGQFSVYIHGGFQEGLRWYRLWSPWMALILLLSLLAFGL